MSSFTVSADLSSSVTPPELSADREGSPPFLPTDSINIRPVLPTTSVSHRWTLLVRMSRVWKLLLFIFQMRSHQSRPTTTPAAAAMTPLMERSLEAELIRSTWSGHPNSPSSTASNHRLLATSPSQRSSHQQQRPSVNGVHYENWSIGL